MSSNYPYQSTKNKKKLIIQKENTQQASKQTEDWEGKFDNLTQFIDYSNQDSLSKPNKMEPNINNNFNSEAPNPKFQNKKPSKQEQQYIQDSMREKLLNDESQIADLEEQQQQDLQEQNEEKQKKLELEQEQEKQKKQKKKIRLTSLDVFRGLTMTGMILVDDTGDDRFAIWPIAHSYWFGWTTADQIFPNFLFIMGLAIPFAFRNREEARGSCKAWVKLFKRGFLLVLFGMMLNAQSTIPNIFELSQEDYKYCFYFRVLGIMQRLGICYMIVSAIHLIFDKLWKQVLVYLVFIAVYLGFLYGYNVPSYYYETMKDNCDTFEPQLCYCEGNGQGNLASFCCNFEGYIDYLILGPHYGWDGHTQPTDPEGFWGYLTSVFNTFMGLCTCLMMNKYKHNSKDLLKNWSLLGLGFGFTGFFLSIWIPLNKDLWTISFMFGTIGISILCLVFLYWFIDLYGKNRKFVQVICQPFIWLGMNPLFIYILMMFEQNLLQDNLTLSDGTSVWDWFLNNVFVSWTNDKVGSFLCAIFYWVIWTLIAGLLYKLKIFIKL